MLKVPSVTMNGGSLMRVTSKPLRSPNSAVTAHGQWSLPRRALRNGHRVNSDITTTSVSSARPALVTPAANQCHKWAHMAGSGIPAAARLAQRLRLILPPDLHRRHHTPPHDSHYCTASGWLNGPLDSLLKRWR